MKPKILISTFLIAAAAACASAAEVTFEQANELYKQGKFLEAEQAYRELLKQHPGSPELHYNLGNAAFKQKKTGVAVLEYKRSKLITPRDRSVNHNLNYVQSLIEYKLEDKRNWYLIYWDRFMDRFALKELAFLSLVFFALYASTFLTGLLARQAAAFGAARFFLTLFLLTVVPLVWKYYDQNWRRDAVVVSPKAVVRYGPSESDKVGFRLVEGLTVSVQDRREGWYLVSLVNGAIGWCEKKDLELVQPL